MNKLRSVQLIWEGGKVVDLQATFDEFSGKKFQQKTLNISKFTKDTTIDGFHLGKKNTNKFIKFNK